MVALHINLLFCTRLALNKCHWSIDGRKLATGDSEAEALAESYGRVQSCDVQTLRVIPVQVIQQIGSWNCFWILDNCESEPIQHLQPRRSYLDVFEPHSWI